MLYQIIGETGTPLDAHFEVNGKTIRFLSRGGSKAQVATNIDYGVGLRLILTRLQAAGISIEGAWVDSSRVQGIPLHLRQVLSPKELDTPIDQLFTKVSASMKTIGQAGNMAGKTSGNGTRKLRIDLVIEMPEPQIAGLLGGALVKKDVRSLDRLPATDLEKITAEHVWRAVQALLAGSVAHGFGPSTDFDLLADNGIRLPPKAVFGIAASDALGFKVLPRHFTAGIGSPCFRLLKASGYPVVRKGEADPTVAAPPSPEDQAWSEGQSKLVSHLKKERWTGLSAAKKAAFKAKHGRLYCERCDLDPIKVYGAEAGESCIEVHHSAIQVKDMAEDHKTTLADLQCLCANCHRVVHRLMKIEAMDAAVLESMAK